MNCPKCGHHSSRVTDSGRAGTRSGLSPAFAQQAGNITRRRKCIKCSHRWRTIEVSADDVLAMGPDAVKHAAKRYMARMLSDIAAEVARDD